MCVEKKGKESESFLLPHDKGGGQQYGRDRSPGIVDSVSEVENNAPQKLAVWGRCREDRMQEANRGQRRAV
jgi:hypothetical protein